MLDMKNKPTHIVRRFFSSEPRENKPSLNKKKSRPPLLHFSRIYFCEAIYVKVNFNIIRYESKFFNFSSFLRVCEFEKFAKEAFGSRSLSSNSAISRDATDSFTYFEFISNVYFLTVMLFRSLNFDSVMMLA